MNDFLSQNWKVVVAAVDGLLAFLLANAVVNHFLNAAANGIQP